MTSARGVAMTDDTARHDPEATLVHDAQAPTSAALAWDVTMAPGMVAWHWRRMLRTMPALAMAPALAAAEDHTLRLHRPAPDPGLTLSAGELAWDVGQALGAMEQSRASHVRDTVGSYPERRPSAPTGPSIPGGLGEEN
jgi:hypothetical protein